MEGFVLKSISSSISVNGKKIAVKDNIITIETKDAIIKIEVNENKDKNTAKKN